MAAGQEIPRIVKLTARNYLLWKFSMQNYIESKGQEDLIQNGPPDDDDPEEEEGAAGERNDANNTNPKQKGSLAHDNENGETGWIADSRCPIRMTRNRNAFSN